MPRVELTAEQQELERQRGQAFATWLGHAMQSRGMSTRELARTIGCSPSSIALYLRGGWDDALQRTRRPRDTMVDAIAQALGASASDGRQAAGYTTREDARLLPERIAQLPPNAMQALLQFLDVLEAGHKS